MVLPLLPDAAHPCLVLLTVAGLLPPLLRGSLRPQQPGHLPAPVQQQRRKVLPGQEGG